MRRFNWNNLSTTSIDSLSDHLYGILGRASEVRLLRDDEMDIWISIELYRCGLMSFGDFVGKLKEYYS